jgi:hypothetical protein
MKVVVDTTVFGQGFNSQSADVRLLKSFLECTPAELCVPAVVLEEAVNLVRKSIEDVNLKLGAAQRLTGDEKTYPKLDVTSGLATYRESLDVLLKYLNARILPYPSIGHQDLVRRALAPNKPFVSSGRGYRDALIWFSVLELAQSCNQEVSFISANLDDWCQSKKDLQLHGDLLSDLNSKGMSASRVRFFVSLGEFSEQCAIATLPVSSQSAEITTHPPDYQQLLIDGKEWVETILADALPEFLRALSRADARVEEVEVVGTNAPKDIRSSPIRVMDSERRLLQFSAEYRVALQFLIRRSDLAIWSHRLSLHLRQEWDETRLRVQATIGIRAFFHMIERGENTEGLSVVSISPTDVYMREFPGVDPVAVKLDQTEIHAPQHTTWGTVKCESCGEEFGVGCHRLYPTNTEREYVTKLERILAADHKAGRPHENLYDLVAYAI